MAPLPLILALAAAVAQPAWETCPNGDMELPRAGGDVCIGRLAPNYAFGFGWTAEAAAIPELDALLRAEAAQREQWMREQSEAAWAERLEAGAEPMRFTYEEGWSLDLNRPELAAASGSAQSYTGGAHGGIAYHAILLDRRRGERVALADLFTDAGEGLAAVQASFCPALLRDVRERRSDEEVAEIECPMASEHPITLVAGFDDRAIGMLALLNPYVVGSWAEGPYDVAFPMTPRLMAALKPEYRGAFSLPPE